MPAIRHGHNDVCRHDATKIIHIRVSHDLVTWLDQEVRASHADRGQIVSALLADARARGARAEPKAVTVSISYADQAGAA